MNTRIKLQSFNSSLFISSVSLQPPSISSCWHIVNLPRKPLGRCNLGLQSLLPACAHEEGPMVFMRQDTAGTLSSQGDQPWQCIDKTCCGSLHLAHQALLESLRWICESHDQIELKKMFMPSLFASFGNWVSVSLREWKLTIRTSSAEMRMRYLSKPGLNDFPWNRDLMVENSLGRDHLPT